MQNLRLTKRSLQLVLFTGLAIIIGFILVPSQPSPPVAWASSACDIVTQVPSSECRALVALYNSTDGNNWIDDSNWLASYYPCSWYGVNCNSGHVTELYLSDNRLHGSIPPEITNLTRLTNLWLNNNRLNGEIPPELGSMSSLTDLLLNNNQFNGPIPPEIGQLSHLQTLTLANNRLTGEFPVELGQLNEVYNLNVSNNQLSGPIPMEIGNWTGLNSIDLSGNQFSGAIPSSLGNLDHLNRLNLACNKLDGQIPWQIGTLTGLTSLNLSGNQLSGTIPSTLGDLDQLSSLNLSGNEIGGQIPEELGNMDNLHYLYLNGNPLEGPLPTSFYELDLWSFTSYNSNLCDPAVLQFWLNGIYEEQTTEISCESPQANVKRRGVAVASVRDYPSAISNSSQSLEKAQNLNMDVVYFPLGWDQIEIRHNEYNWRVLLDILEQAQTYNMQVVLRIYNPPPWRTLNGAPAGAPPVNPDDLNEFMTLLVNTVQAGYVNPTSGDYFPGRPEVVAGYVIWNEPNIAEQWGGQAPNPAEYMALLRAAYEGVKASDPGAVVVSAPLAPTADKSGHAINDLTYLSQLYDLGLAQYTNAIGMNGLGFQHDPDYDSGQPDYNFMRLKYLHDVMEAKGDNIHPVWALETGWLRNSSNNMGSFEPFKVSAAEQAQYLTRALKKANDEWPWLDMLVIWNLDFDRFYPINSSFHWYSMANNPWANILLTDTNPPQYRQTITTLGGNWSPSEDYLITVGPGVLNTTVQFILTTYAELKDVAIDGFKTVGINFSLEAHDEIDLSAVVFNSPIQVYLPIPDQVVDLESVTLYTYHPDRGWVDTCEEPGNSCEINGHQLKTNLSHLSQFTMGVSTSFYLPIIMK